MQKNVKQNLERKENILENTNTKNTNIEICLLLCVLKGYIKIHIGWYNSGYKLYEAAEHNSKNNFVYETTVAI